MTGRFRYWLARKLCPLVFMQLDEANYLKRQLYDLHWWCAEFPDIHLATRWLRQCQATYSGTWKDGESGRLPSTISDFREMLRRRQS